MTAQPPDAGIRRREFIAIATSEYTDRRFSRLRRVVNEVATLEAWLCDGDLQDRGFEHVHRELAANPSKRQIEEALSRGKADQGWQESTAAVIYVTGHGLTKDATHWLILKDTNYGALWSTALPTPQIIAWLKETGPKHLLLVLDTCFAGKAGEVAAGFDQRLPRTWLVLPSAMKDEEASTCALTTAVQEVLAELAAEKGLKWGKEPYLTVQDFVNAINDKLDEGQEVYPLYGSQLYGPHVCLPNPHYTAPAAALTSSARRDLALPKADLEAHWGPRARGVAAPDDPGWLFFGRAALIRRLISAATGDPGVLLVTGGAGSGKSAALARLVTLSDPDFCALYEHEVSLIPGDLMPPAAAVDVAVLATGKNPVEIMAQICRAAGAAEPDGPSPGLADYQARWYQALAQRTAPITIVIDALDEAANPAEVLTALQQLEPADVARPLVRLLIGVRSTGGGQDDVPRAGPKQQPLADLAQDLLRVDPGQGRIWVDQAPWWVRDDVSGYVASMLRASPDSPYLADDRHTKAVADVVADAAGASFLLARIAGQQLAARSEMVDLHDAAWRASISRGVFGVFHADLHATLPEPDDRERGVHLLRAVAFGRGRGLPWGSIWPLVANAVADQPGRYGDHDILWLLQTRLGGYLVTDQEDGVTVYRLFHQDLRATLRERWQDLLAGLTGPDGAGTEMVGAGPAKADTRESHRTPASPLYFEPVDLDQWRQQRAAVEATASWAGWVEQWCWTAAAMRTDDLDRLVAQAQLPPLPGYPTLAGRLIMAQQALAQRNWAVAAPVLRAAAAGLRIGDREVPEADVRAALLVLLARIAVALGEDPSADLDAARALGAGPGEVAAVRAWDARRDGHPAEAAARLAEACVGPLSTAALAEVVRQAPAGQVLPSARAELGRLPSLSGILSELDRLVEPVPAELWLAVAQRSAAEQNAQLAIAALDRAQPAAGSDHELDALIWEQRSELLNSEGASLSARANALLSAGNGRLVAGQPELARRHFQAALDLDPGDVQAALRLAEAEASIWLPRPIGDSAQYLAEAAASLDALHSQHGVDLGSAWSLFTDAAVHLQLASGPGDARISHPWRAALAAARSLVFDPGDADCWIQLSDALGLLGLYQSAAFTARRAQALEPSPSPSENVLDRLISNAANLGELQTAMELLPPDADHAPARIQAVAGYVRWRLGHGETAIRLLRLATTADASLTWARQLLAWAYVLTGDHGLARQAADGLRADLAEQASAVALNARADAALILGDLAGAQQLGRDLIRLERGTVDDGSGLAVVGKAALLDGHAEGLDDLAGWLERARSPLTLDDWYGIDRPALQALAQQRGGTLPDLACLDEAISRRRITLAGWADPVAELADAPRGTTDPLIIDQASALLSVLVREASADPVGAWAALTAGPVGAVPEWPRLTERVLVSYVADCVVRGDLDVAAAAEVERLTGAPDTSSAGRLPEIARLLSVAERYDDAKGVLDAARERIGDLPVLTRAEGDVLWRRGRRDAAAEAWKAARAAGGSRLEARLAAWAAQSDGSAAAGLLRDAILRSYADTAADLGDLALAGADVAALIEALVKCTADADTVIGAAIVGQVLEALPERVGLPTIGLELHLSPSWFAGVPDPNRHPLLTRYLPELRLRQPWHLPRISLQIAPDLDPGGYRIFVLGMPADVGSVPGDADYASADVVPLLSAAAQARLTGEWMDMVMLRGTEGPATGLDSLLLMTPAEVLAFCLERLVTAFRKVLEQFQRSLAYP